jgi:hypothetical protein
MKTRKKSLRRRKGGAVLKKSEFDNPLQHLIEALGDEEILDDFAEFNGRDGCQFLQSNKRVSIVPLTFSGVAYDGGHWKGYEAAIPGKQRTVYDSYVANLQMSASNNFCQSFATYMWAKHGNIQPFVPGKYADNVQKMSQIWIQYFNSILSGSNTNLKTWLVKSLEEGSDISFKKGWGRYTISEILDTLAKLVSDEKFRTQFSTSY